MTTAILPDHTMFGARRPERGVSSDAQILRDAVDQAFLSSPSITLGGWKQDLLRRVIEVASEAAVANWDGDKSEAVERSTVQYAQAFAAALPPDIDAPDVSVDHDGDIDFEWHYGPRRVFSVSVSRDGVIYYAGLIGPNRFHGSEVLLWGIPRSIPQNVRRAQRGY